MAIDFPVSPTANQQHTDAVSGNRYFWTGTYWRGVFAPGTKGDKGDAGIAGTAVAKGDKGDKGPPGVVSALDLDSLTDVTIITPVAGQVLKYSGSGWINDADAVSGGAGVGTVTNVTIASVNGFTGTVATSSSTPAITIATSVTGLLKGNGTAVSAATSGTDYQGPITLTTTGSSGAATFSNNTLNIPQYAAASDLNIFSTIAVAGQSNVVANSATNLLTLVAGTNVTITTNANTDTITINATGGGGGTLDGLSDVVITGTPTNGQVLKYDTGTGTWVNGTDATAGAGSSNSFETIAVAGQSSVVADSSTDTLTLVAGTGITITTVAGTDTITIASTVSAGATALTGLSDVTSASLTVDKFYLPAITKLTVTASGTSGYLFDQYSGNNPTIYATSGTTIAFDLGSGALSSHPFLIRFSGANYDTGLVHVSNAGVVTTGASAQAKTSGTLYWKIPVGTFGTYGYLCQNHPGSMIGAIIISDGSAAIGGSNTGIIFNDSTFANTSANLTYNKSTNILTIAANTSLSNNYIIQPIFKSYSEHKQSNSVSGSTTLDLSQTNVFELTLTANISFIFSNPPTSTVYTFTLIAKQDATGSRTITWPASVKWPGAVVPPATTAANAVDIWSGVTYDGGTTYAMSLSMKDVR